MCPHFGWGKTWTSLRRRSLKGQNSIWETSEERSNIPRPLATLALEGGRREGTWSQEAKSFVQLLAEARARSEPPLMRRGNSPLKRHRCSSSVEAPKRYACSTVETSGLDPVSFFLFLSLLLSLSLCGREWRNLQSWGHVEEKWPDNRYGRVPASTIQHETHAAVLRRKTA